MRASELRTEPKMCRTGARYHYGPAPNVRFGSRAALVTCAAPCPIYSRSWSRPNPAEATADIRSPTSLGARKVTVERPPRLIRLPLGVKIRETSRQSAPSALASCMTRCCSSYRVSAGSVGARSATSGSRGFACIQAEVESSMEHQPKYDFTSARGGPSFSFPRRLPGQEGHLCPRLQSFRSSMTMRRSALR